MADALYVLPVHQPDADNLVRGKMRQLARNFPCEPRFVGCWVAIQATSGDALHREQWSIVGVGKLAGVCYYPGFTRDPEQSVGKTYKRDTGMAGAWGWTFTHMKALEVEAIPLRRLPEVSGSYDPGLKRRIWEWKDDGSGDWWGCCPRPLDDAMVRCVQEARRKRGR